ncbi:MAG: hypothetical protein V1660_01985 [archaeon]
MYNSYNRYKLKNAKKAVKRGPVKKKLKAKCSKCKKRIVGKICYFKMKIFCRKCFNDRKYENGARRRWVSRKLRGRPSMVNLEGAYG